MSVVIRPKKTAPVNWHRADIIAALHKNGWSMRGLSVANGLSEHTLKTAMTSPYPKAEKIIAAAIGVEAEAIWPERYAKRNFTPVLTLVTNFPRTLATEMQLDAPTSN
ncbi:transcriptional regulator [Duganella sp. CY15W]|uniref:helix-turn-helix domain-containing protein n=1 Tax=Duganella sp. CY15W TaxID=2692172 RepID=UPI00136A6434|nr:helix-turn-helix domain-containing protein [Duganella sp. CY15W]MYM32230.1 transcriptional regulator [Duganella sp. CY15W]